jgi:[ribosomal protein S5]-alanine N-acetyltransferase
VTQRRLRWERPWQEHLPLYRALFADPAVARSLWPPRGGSEPTEDRGPAVLAEDIRHWQERSFGPWVFFATESGLFVGRGGLRTTTVGERRCVEVAYAVRSEEWGHGYATEMATVAVAHARKLGITEIVGLSATTNPASRRVLEKCGMRYERTVQRAGIAHWLGGLHPIV